MIDHIMYWGTVAVTAGIITACILAIILFVMIMVTDRMAD